MSIISLYSKRKRAKEHPTDDVFEYEKLPTTLRVQIIQMFEEAVSQYDKYNHSYYELMISPSLLEDIIKILRREYGLRTIGGDQYHSDHLSELLYFISNSETDQFLDCVELYCRIVTSDTDINEKTKKALIDEVNHRFREAGIGFEYNKEIIRIDSKLVHSGAIKPVIKLLSSDPVFKGAENEFFSAFSHYKEGKNKEAIADALKAFESAMKAILTKQQWEYHPNDTASKLIKACLSNGLVPPYLQTHITSLRSLLESGLPTVRNKTSGHGQGVNIQSPEDRLTSFALYMTAINIKYLIECDSDLP